MDDKQIDDILLRTIADYRISRGEKKVLAALKQEYANDEQRLAYLRHRAFEVARAELINPHSKNVLNWLEDTVKALHAPPPQKSVIPNAEVFFSPGEECKRRIIELFSRARRQVDVCVFTITDNRISDTIIQTHKRGIAVRVITDNEKAEDLGSDIERLGDSGIPVRVDRTRHHMHHKFAIFDNKVVLSGSYNWTRSAAEFNEENVVISNDLRLVRDFSKEFVELWNSLA